MRLAPDAVPPRSHTPAVQGIVCSGASPCKASHHIAEHAQDCEHAEADWSLIRLQVSAAKAALSGNLTEVPIMSCNHHQNRCNSFCGCSSSCPFPEWMQPRLCCPTHMCHAHRPNGPTLIIHQIVLEACGEQSCTPRSFSIRITGPSYPCGEVFTLRAGSCIELDEPLVITGLEPGKYTIEPVFSCPNQYITTITGPVCGHTVLLPQNGAPTVVTLVSRRRLCRLCQGFGCGCGCNR